MKISKAELLKSNENLIRENELLKKRIEDLERINKLYHEQMQELRKHMVTE